VKQAEQERTTYNGGDGEVVLLRILEEAKNVVTDDDTLLAGQFFEDTHDD
jgi:hypothetical protein